jgi:hypothetical protein
LNKENKEKAKKEKKQENEDPYLIIGFGMVAYFKMLKSLILMFIIFTLLSIPAICIYTHHNGQKDLVNYSKSRYTLGNLGFS